MISPEVNLLAIPGQPTQAAGRPSPAEIARALDALAALAARIEDEALFGFLDGPALRCWASVDPSGEDVLHCLFRGDVLTRRRMQPVVIEHRWGVLAEREDWWVAGWHASRQVMALSPRGRRLLDEAINGPHTLHWPAARRAARRR